MQDNPTQQPNIILEKEELDETLLTYSREHFAHAQGSPFTVETLSRLLNYDGLTPFGDRVLQGRPNVNHLELDEPTKTLLKNLKNKTTPEISRQHPLDYTMLMQGGKMARKDNYITLWMAPRNI